jgi:hypothetical protein
MCDFVKNMHLEDRTPGQLRQVHCRRNLNFIPSTDPAWWLFGLPQQPSGILFLGFLILRSI